MSGEFSPGALRERLGERLWSIAVAAADGAPPPSPRLVEQLRLIFAPSLARLARGELPDAGTEPAVPDVPRAA